MRTWIEIVLGATGLLFSVVGIFVLLPRIQVETAFLANGGSNFYEHSPKRFPGIALITIAALSVAHMLFSLAKLRRDPGKGVAKREKMPLKPILSTVLICIVYAGAMAKVGFIISTLFALMILLSFFEMKGWAHRVALSIGFTAFVSILFQKIMDIQLPSGPLGF